MEAATIQSLQPLQPQVSPAVASVPNAPEGADHQGKSQKLDVKDVKKDATPSPLKNLENIKEDVSKEEQAKRLKEAVDELNRNMSPLNFGIRFGFSDEIDSMYVSVYERKTNKIIRKIPTDEAMQLMAKMREIVGMIFDKKG